MTKSINDKNSISPNLDELSQRIEGYIQQARQNILHSVDTEMVKAYWLSGRDIVEEEQHGQARANYAGFILRTLSERLTKRYGKGFGLTTLKYMRRFYLTYPVISHTVCDQSLLTFSPNLSWSHYRLLMQVDRKEARAFYEVEASKNCWSVRELDRQIGSLLFDRLAKSKDKAGLMQLAAQGQELIDPADAIKDPFILEFLNLPEAYRLVESRLEEALITNLQHFLLELGRGFSFMARQKRLTIDGDHFYADLVFYHVILKSYIIIDIKTDKLSHADLGQIQLYVNYFDQELKQPNDNPTIGLILCTKKNTNMVKYFLGEKAKQIFASTYQFHLPTEEELERELKRELKLLQPFQTLKENKDKD